MTTSPTGQTDDFWEFVDVAGSALSARQPQADIDATRLLLMLNRASDVVTYDLESSVHRAQGSTWAAFRVLYVLWLAGPMDARHVARLTNMSRAAVSNVVSTLVGRGHLASAVRAEDHRAKELSLTTEGQHYIERTYAQQNEREQEWAALLTDQDRADLSRILDRLMSGRRSIGARERT